MEQKQVEMLVVVLRGVTVLPGMTVQLDIEGDTSKKSARLAMESNQNLFLVSQKEHNENEDETSNLYTIGTVVRVKQIVKLQGRLIRVLVEGVKRAYLRELVEEDTHLRALVEAIPEVEGVSEAKRLAGMRVVKEALRVYLEQNPRASKELDRLLESETALEEYLDLVASNFPLTQLGRRHLLETLDLEERWNLLVQLILDETAVSQLKNSFNEKVKQRIDKNQKEYILREQLKLIQEELGMESNAVSDSEEYLAKLSQLQADQSVKKRIEKEIKRFRTTPYGGQEAYVLQNYIENLLNMPWEKKTEEVLQLDKAERILNQDHYGLEKVKERILEYLAVRKLSGGGDAPILCLVGPPGTGKTSIAQSVARAMNKQYVRISLGGVRDEAEIRGHRRTYVGAMPGRIVEGIKQAGVKNPLMLLDEIDKVGNDAKGDTASALLEVLDGEQNYQFRDHYLELPIDLSEVLFFATANTTSTIPRPLLDRMEIIEVSSYTANEKYHIAKKYLLPKQLKRNGLTTEQLHIDKRAIEKIIQGYTRESGVRNLERKIGAVCRKSAKALLAGEKKILVNCRNLMQYLGKELARYDMKNAAAEIGICRGLAWTSVGGDTLQIEVNCMPGTGRLQTTGQMGEVMKESAQIALSYVRSVSEEYQIADDYFEKHDLHLHIPEGAVPKDGPSAGVTMATAMLSAVCGKKIEANLAMTGEITLRGRVLAVGGLKEKVLAAKMADITRVLVPAANQSDIEELSGEITDGIQISYMKSMPEVLKQAFLAL